MHEKSAFQFALFLDLHMWIMEVRLAASDESHSRYLFSNCSVCLPALVVPVLKAGFELKE